MAFEEKLSRYGGTCEICHKAINVAAPMYHDPKTSRVRHKHCHEQHGTKEAHNG